MGASCRLLRLLQLQALTASSSSCWGRAAAACGAQGACGDTHWHPDVQQRGQLRAGRQQRSSDWSASLLQPHRRQPEVHSALLWRQQTHSSSSSSSTAVLATRAACTWHHQQLGAWQLQAARRCLHAQQQQQQQRRAPGASWTSVPNLLSLSRVASGPVVAYLIATQQWPAAVALTATAGVTDWADGYMARRLGHTSKLGSYLDPAADKVMIGCVVGALSWQQLLPAWLAALVLGRDAVQFAGMAAYRLRMFGGAWPGAAAFFDVDRAPPPASASSSSGKAQAGGGRSGQSVAPQAGGLPAIRPLLVSKANTALIFVLVGGCMTQQWLGLPGQELLDALEVAIAGTTAASAAAYAAMYVQGRLLPDARGSVRR